MGGWGTASKPVIRRGGWSINLRGVLIRGSGLCVEWGGKGRKLVDRFVSGETGRELRWGPKPLHRGTTKGGVQWLMGLTGREGWTSPLKSSSREERRGAGV